MKVAIVHDFLTYWGGAEQVLKSLHNLYPDAPIYTLLYDRKMDQYFPNARIRPSFLNKFPEFLKKRKKFLLPFFPTAVETFDLSAFDLVISSSSSFAKGVIVKPKTFHISYCHTPTRFLWDWYYNYLEENNVGKIKKLVVVPILHILRLWDYSASERVDFYIANSEHTARKIKKFYRAESSVIYPPVDFEKFSQYENLPSVAEKDYYLIVSRLSAYKKIDIAIQAFNKMNMPLVVIGEGCDKKRLQKMAGKSVKLLGFQSEEKLAAYYQNAKAVIFPGEDDFGITILEAMSFGKPVLAYAKGGALETVTPGRNGELFESPVPEILADGVRRLNRNLENYNSIEIREYARQFSRENFEKKIEAFVGKVCERKA
ncbi:MAG: glycosyltransferase [Candidatus Paceibacterota bacterium]